MMILCEVVSVNLGSDWKTGLRPLKFSVAAVYDRRTGQRPVFLYFVAARAFFSAVALASASLYDARSIA